MEEWKGSFGGGGGGSYLVAVWIVGGVGPVLGVEHTSLMLFMTNS